MYVVPLATNFRGVLLEAAPDPDYLVPGDEPILRTQEIVDFWMARWLARRANNERARWQVEQHTLAYPIDHGARVRLPDAHADTPLFMAAWEE